jgi:glycosyltransferase involved in cell wall biosynthesis
MIKIFISIPWFLPAFKAGGPVQSIANMVEALHEGYEFFIYTSNTDLNALPIAVTKTNEWLPFNDYTKVWYAGKAGRSQHLVEEVTRIKPDVLYMIGLYSWHFTQVPLFFSNAPRKILSVRGMLHPGALGEKQTKKKIFLSAMKLAGVSKRCCFQATDDAEARYIKDAFGTEIDLQVAGNFPRLLPERPAPGKRSHFLTLVSVGLLSPMKNYLLVLEALMNAKDTIDYHIYGPVKDVDYWDRCLAVIRTMPSNITVHYHKELPPHKLVSRLSDKHVFILPSKSENFGHALFEALSAGLPVISSRFTPWNELEANRAGLNVETNTEAILTAIEFFAGMEAQTFRVYSEGAAAYARARYDRDTLVNAYAHLFGLEKVSPERKLNTQL